ncbi:hypothetical protein LDENG_00270380, partial [Lucifuga dentata]
SKPAQEPQPQSSSPGDLIEVFCDNYQHWAVYIGDEDVIHLITTSNAALTEEKGVIRRDRLTDVVGNFEWRINNSLDKKYKPRPIQDIVNDALASVAKEMVCDLTLWVSEYFATQLRYGKAESQQEPDRGDLIQVFRGSFQHWAVYVGDGKVVHLVTTSNISGSIDASTDKEGIVMKESLKKVVGIHKWKVNNNQDKKQKPRSVPNILADADTWVGQDVKYNLTSWNCEHFANMLRYGKAKSQQVNDAAIGVGTILAVSASAVSGAVLARR